jgi:hypothetical protein
MLRDFRPEHAAEFLAFRDRWHSERPRRVPRRAPEFLLARDGGYDPLHVPRDLNDHFQFIPLTLAKTQPLASLKTEDAKKTLLQQLQQFQKAVRRRDA